MIIPLGTWSVAIIPSLSYTKISIRFVLDYERWHFFGWGKVCDFQMFRLKIHVSLKAIIWFKNFSPLLNRLKCSYTILRNICFCKSVNVCSTHHAATFFFNKCSVKIQWTIVRRISASTFPLIVTIQSLSNIVVTTAMHLLLINVEAQQDQWLSFLFTLLSLKHLWYCWIVGTSIHCCISTNLFQRNTSNGNCIATQSFDLDVCTMHTVWT